MIQWIDAHSLEYDDFIFYPIQSYDRGDKTAKQKHTRYESLRATIRPIMTSLFNKGLPADALMRRASLYSLRRTGATKVYRLKGLAVASKFLHHSDVRTTMKYLGIDDDTKDAIYAL